MESKPTEILSSLAAASFPLLVYDYGEQPNNSQIMLSVADGSSRTYQVPEMRKYMFMHTPCGLVLIVDNDSLQTSLWNPQTGEKITLPAMEKELPEYCQCLLSGTISSPHCLVLIYDLSEPELLFCQVKGGTTWFSQSYDVGLYELPATHPDSHLPPTKRTINGMAAVEGKFFFHKSRDVVGVFSFAHDPEPHFEMTTFYTPMPNFISDLSENVTMPYLLESSQELFLVCLFFHGCTLEEVGEVSAYKMDFSKQEWCKVTDIGDRVFLLGPGSFAASCCAMEHGLKRGCVYFAYDFLGDSNDYHIFDLMEGTHGLTVPTHDMPVLSGQPFWLVPVLP
ncbi:hypothetical protein QOZ80_1BG0059620 [Eleusine coracana subsp. coracana]|nr:hypothetical protein QOZ80_1BG0059620 [Eleusine coracana subsp. coracana]